MNKLEIIDPKFESKVLVDRPLLIPISLLEPENEKRQEPNVPTITDIPLELVKAIFMNLHPLELYCCYGVSQGIHRIVKKKLIHPETLGVYFSDKVCVVFSDGKYCKYTKEEGGCGYGYGTYKKNKCGHYMEGEIPYESAERIGFLENVRYDKAGLNVFLSVLTNPGNQLLMLMIHVKDGFNPNKFITKIEKKLKSLNENLLVGIVMLIHVTPKQVMRILPYLKPNTLKRITIYKNAYGKEDNETMGKITRTKQYKQAKKFQAMFPSMIPIRKYFHFDNFTIMKNKMTAREVANIKNSMFKHVHIQEIEVLIEDTAFDIGIARRVLGPCIPDPTDPEAGLYHGPNGVLDIFMYRDDDGMTNVVMKRMAE